MNIFLHFKLFSSSTPRKWIFSALPGFPTTPTQSTLPVRDLHWLKEHFNSPRQAAQPINSRIVKAIELELGSTPATSHLTGEITG
jgi:hypothetical protein